MYSLYTSRYSFNYHYSACSFYLFFFSLPLVLDACFVQPYRAERHVVKGVATDFSIYYCYLYTISIVYSSFSSLFCIYNIKA